MSQFNFTYRIKYLYLIQILDSRPLFTIYIQFNPILLIISIYQLFVDVFI